MDTEFLPAAACSARRMIFSSADNCWTIRYLVVDTGWLFGRRVLVANALMLPRGARQAAADCSAPAATLEYGGFHLRSAREIRGSHIEATDGEIGYVDDLIVDDETWTIRDIVVDTCNRIPGRRVSIAPSWATEIDWHDQLVVLDHDRGALNNAPLRDPITPIRRDDAGGASRASRARAHLGTLASRSNRSPDRKRISRTTIKRVLDQAHCPCFSCAWNGPS